MNKKNILYIALIIILGMSLLGCETDNIEGSTESVDTVTQENGSENINESDNTVIQESGSENINESDNTVIQENGSDASDETFDIKSLSVKAKNLAKNLSELKESIKEDVKTNKSVESKEEVDIEEPQDFTVSISVERTGNIITNRSALHVLIDGEEAFTVRGNSTEGTNMILSKGTHTIQVKGQGDKSKKLEFNVSEDSPNYFYFWAEISNWWGIKFERRLIN